MFRIKKDDQVVVITGKDKGKTGKVLEVLPRQQRAVVENINITKKSRRKTQQNPDGGFVEVEASLHISNIMLLDKKTNKPTRIKISTENGKKVRISKKSQEVI